MDTIRFILRLPYFLLHIILEACLYFLYFLLLILKGISWFFSPIIGQIDWSIPRWYPRSKAIYQTTIQTISKHSTLIGSVIYLSIVAYASGNYAYHWYLNRPKPIEPAPIIINTYGVDFTKPTESGIIIDQNPYYNSLKIHFTGNKRSPAPIDKIGKQITEGIQITPEIKGTWKWNDPRTISFTPETTWNIAEKYTVTMDDSKLLDANNLIAKNKESFTFTTKEFILNIKNKEFYQNPVDATEKLGIFEVHFSHPVDKKSFENNLKLALYETTEDKNNTRKFIKNVHLTTTYNSTNTIAYIKSEPLEFAERDQYLILDITKGITSSLGGNLTESDRWDHILIPNKYHLHINSAEVSLVEISQNEIRQILTIKTNYNIKANDLQKAIKVWQLPLANFKYSEEYYDKIDGKYKTKFLVGKNTLNKSKILPTKYVETGDTRTYQNQFSFEINGEQSQQLYITIDPSLISEGGYAFKEGYKKILRIKRYPQIVNFASAGSLLSLSGEKKIPVVTRNTKKLKLELKRVIPSQLQHLVSDNVNEFSQMRFDYLNTDNFVEKYAIEKEIKGNPQSIKYTDFDLTPYLKKDIANDSAIRGIFLLNLYADNPDNNGKYAYYDSRFIIVTDLGIINKKSLDQSYDLFVQSISNGDPIENAKVSLLGANGIEITAQQTDSTGHVHFAPLSEYYKGIKPLLFLIEKDGDMSFLPISKGYRGYDRQLNYSRFDVGGEYETLDRGELRAHLFSDRGIYRPGDTFHIGTIIKADDWNKSLKGIRLEADIYDPKNNLLTTKKIKLDEYGFNEISYKTEDNSPTGNWNIYLYLSKPNHEDDRTYLGSTSVIIREFEPDKTAVKVQITPRSEKGWIKQSELKAQITANNLFGTPAQDRLVESNLHLYPTKFYFKQYLDYDFFRYGNNQSDFKVDLEDTYTNEEGKATVNLNVENFDGQYEARFLADVFEPNSGRSVAATDTILISSADYLVGGKADGILDYIKRDTKRLLNLIAINPELEKIRLDNLKLITLEKKYLSVLVKQPSGVFKYESERKNVVISETPFEINDKGTTYQIPTDTPGNFILQIKNNHDEIVYQVDYSIAGTGNVTRSLDRNAELALKIDATKYKPGDEIEVSITAPYTGSGIITIERDKVYAWKWFKTDTTSSIQKITLPKEVEGNAYINVQFVRDPNSEEIFMSPLSYGVVPFTITNDKFTEKVTLVAPEQVKPGETIPITVTTNSMQRVVVFAVDEGILQVAGYQLKNPLKSFIRKKTLSVRTDQILDLILPEYNRLLKLSAPGGDDMLKEDQDMLNGHLNPFKRKTDEPVVYWSGIIDVEDQKNLSYKIPEHFSGKIRIMAVTVGKNTIGTAQTSTTVRNDFVLSPNIPYFVTPNDEFEISLMVANNLTEIGNEEIPIKVKLTTTPHLMVVDEPSKTIKLASMKEGTLTYRLKATDILGSGDLQFTATYKDKIISRQVSTSVRPINPYRLKTIMGRMDGKTQTINEIRQMYPEFAEQDAAVSYSPMILVKGLTDYLDNYEYYCSEQIVSRSLPLLIGNKHPEFNLVTDKTLPFNGVLQKLQSRQNSEGAIGLWYATYNVDPYITLYTVNFLLEAKEAGLVLPKDLLTKANEYTKRVAEGSLTGRYNLRLRAYAIYLLTRQNIITTNYIASIMEDLKNNKNQWWETDITALYLASSYKMLKMDKQADKILSPVWKQLDKAYNKAWWTNNFYDPLVMDTGKIYLIAKHFNEKVKDIPAQALENIALMLNQERYTTHSAAMTMLALDSYISSIKELDLKEDDLTITSTIQSNENERKNVTIAKLKKLLAKSKFSDESSAISFHNMQNLPAWYLLSQKGYDRTVQQEPITKGLEVYREYTDKDGKEISTVKLGDIINVTVRIRSLSKEGQTNIAIVDLLPAGFEVVQQNALNRSPNNSENDEDSEEEYDDYDGEQWISPIATGNYTWYPDYTDVREDRVIIYGSTASDNLQTFKYQIKATNIGEYAIPPAYGEAMYDRDIQAVSKGGSKITVETR